MYLVYRIENDVYRNTKGFVLLGRFNDYSLTGSTAKRPEAHATR